MPGAARLIGPLSTAALGRALCQVVA